MSDRIQPALTAEERAKLCLDEGLWMANGALVHFTPCDDDSAIENRHGVAALCLFGEAFGFTHDDVSWLRGIASDPFLPHNGIAANLASRIAALLPPSA